MIPLVAASCRACDHQCIRPQVSSDRVPRTAGHPDLVNSVSVLDRLAHEGPFSLTVFMQ